MAWATKPYRDACDLQRLIVRDAHSDELKPLIRAGLARAFCELEMLKLRLRMKPAPKPIDVQPKRKKEKEQVSFTPTPEPDKPQ